MDHKNAPENLDIIKVDYNGPDIPPGVRDIQPLVYKDGDSICVMEGKDPMDGLFGCGTTLLAALQDFQKQYEIQKENSL